MQGQLSRDIASLSFIFYYYTAECAQCKGTRRILRKSVIAGQLRGMPAPVGDFGLSGILCNLFLDKQGKTTIMIKGRSIVALFCKSRTNEMSM